MKKFWLIARLILEGCITALAVWIAYVMWPASWPGKMVLLAFVFMAIYVACHYLVYGVYVRGLIAGLILRRRPRNDDQFVMFKTDDNGVVQPATLAAYLAALQFSSGRGYYICAERGNEYVNEKVCTLTEAKRAAVAAAASAPVAQDEDADAALEYAHPLYLPPPKSP